MCAFTAQTIEHFRQHDAPEHMTAATAAGILVKQIALIRLRL
jgi:hypothetical protein